MLSAEIRLLGLVKFTWNSRVELNSLPQVGRSCEIMSAHSSLIALEVIDSQLSLQSALCCSQSTLFNLTEIFKSCKEDEHFLTLTQRTQKAIKLSRRMYRGSTFEVVHVMLLANLSDAV